MTGAGPSLSISGEVERPASLAAVDLAALADGELVADFHCREGWSRLGVRWGGVRLATLLAFAGARSEGRYVTLESGGYTVVLEREQAEDEQVLLALERDGRELSPSEGSPRLVGPSEWDCFQSVKAVERIVLTREAAETTAATIALARIERR